MDDGQALQPELTQLFRRVAEGDRHAHEELMPLVYQQLRRIAQVRMAGERREHTLQATALVHEAYAKMMHADDASFANRRHFFFAAADAMRRILIDHARARDSQKRGGGRGRSKLDISAIADLASDGHSDDIIALDEALQRLEEERPRVANVVKLRFYGGMQVDETADMLGVSARTVDLDWAFARAWLYRALTDRLNS